MPVGLLFRKLIVRNKKTCEMKDEGVEALGMSSVSLPSNPITSYRLEQLQNPEPVASER